MTYTPTTRTDALAVTCPQCNAPAGTTCQGARGDRTALHAERHQATVNQHTRETRHYDLGTVGQPDCPDCDSIGFIPIDGIENKAVVTRWHPCPCRT